MNIARRNHTVGDRRRYEVDYRGWLSDKRAITAHTVTSSSDTATVDDDSVRDASQVLFFVNGGVLNETFTVTVSITCSDTEIRHDTIAFTVIAP